MRACSSLPQALSASRVHGVFLARAQVTESQLRDDLLSMLVAGHETTASVLTWPLKLLVDHPAAMAKAQAEADRIVGGAGGEVGIGEAMGMGYVMRCINESMRLYPHPPVLIRRASQADTLPGGCVLSCRVPDELRVSEFVNGCRRLRFAVPANQDIIISVYNIHHSPEVWDKPEEFIPERFRRDARLLWFTCPLLSLLFHNRTAWMSPFPTKAIPTTSTSPSPAGRASAWATSSLCWRQ